MGFMEGELFDDGHRRVTEVMLRFSQRRAMLPET